MKLYLESLGCARNQVDSEAMLSRLSEAGWHIISSPDQADAIVVNTCSFIESAVDESIDTILQLADFKKAGPCRRLVVVGCLPERFREDMVSSLPEVDCFLGTGAFDAVVEAVQEGSALSGCILPDPNTAAFRGKSLPRIISEPVMSYLKISDGCNRRCTYCIIPRLRGSQKSRDLSDIVSEARELISRGAKELVLIAQDTTAWGIDLDPPSAFSGLLRELSGLNSRVRIRMLYGHPQSIDEETIRTIAEKPNLCTYFDIPVQHASDRLLKGMGRRYGRSDLLDLFGRIRSIAPEAALRTSVMVGFPGETDEDFGILLDFMEAVGFDHLGVFTYSGWEDLPSHSLPNPVPPEIAQGRYDQAMSLQQEISENRLSAYIGRTLDVLVEEREADNLFVGRTEYQAPEVDGVTFIRTPGDPDQALINRFIRVRIIDAMEYDLIGESV